MPINILTDVTSLFDDLTAAEVAKISGINKEQVQNCAEKSCTQILAALAEKTNTIDGAEKVYRTVSQFSGQIVLDLRLIASPQSILPAIKLGSESLNDLFGELACAQIESALADHFQIPGEAVSQVVGLCGALTIDQLGDCRKKFSLKRDNLSQIITSQTELAAPPVATNAQQELLNQLGLPTDSGPLPTMTQEMSDETSKTLIQDTDLSNTIPTAEKFEIPGHNVTQPIDVTQNIPVDVTQPTPIDVTQQEYPIKPESLTSKNPASPAKVSPPPFRSTAQKPSTTTTSETLESIFEVQDDGGTPKPKKTTPTSSPTVPNTIPTVGLHKPTEQQTEPKSKLLSKLSKSGLYLALSAVILLAFAGGAALFLRGNLSQSDLTTSETKQLSSADDFASVALFDSAPKADAPSESTNVRNAKTSTRPIEDVSKTSSPVKSLASRLDEGTINGLFDGETKTTTKHVSNLSFAPKGRNPSTPPKRYEAIGHETLGAAVSFKITPEPKTRYWWDDRKRTAKAGYQEVAGWMIPVEPRNRSQRTHFSYD